MAQRVLKLTYEEWKQQEMKWHESKDETARKFDDYGVYFW